NWPTRTPERADFGHSGPRRMKNSILRRSDVHLDAQVIAPGIGALLSGKGEYALNLNAIRRTDGRGDNCTLLDVAVLMRLGTQILDRHVLQKRFAIVEL